MPQVSDRQRVILGLVAKGMTNREIADRLWVTESAVKFQLNLAYKTLGVSSRHEAVERLKEAA